MWTSIKKNAQRRSQAQKSTAARKGHAVYLAHWLQVAPAIPPAAHAVDGIMLMMSIIPTVGAVTAIIALWFCKLDEATVTQMGEALKQRRGEHEGAA